MVSKQASVSARVRAEPPESGPARASFSMDQPMPILPWGSSPHRYATAMGISPGSSRRKHSAKCPILASRLALRVTWVERSASSCSFMERLVDY